MGALYACIMMLVPTPLNQSLSLASLIFYHHSIQRQLVGAGSGGFDDFSNVCDGSFNHGYGFNISPRDGKFSCDLSAPNILPVCVAVSVCERECVCVCVCVCVCQ